ncbi:MAG TPA: ABC transporter permease [Longimicrobiales bacterium]|nr:ABC transporter permease [Longimicrobiales bacterium]
MLVFVVKRLIELLPVLFGVLLVTFAVTRFTPGDPAVLLAGEDADQALIEATRERLGLDRALPTQFVFYVGNALQGDLGRSYSRNVPVTELIGRALVPTAKLAAIAMAITIFIGIPLGVISAVRPDGPLDLAARVVALIGVSVPNFFFGLLLILLFSLQLGLLPSFGTGSWRHLILPGVTLGTFSVGLIARLTRASMLDVLSQDYVRTARAKGLSGMTVVYKHGLRNAAIAIVTILGLNLGSLLSGSVLTEVVFAYPGIGRLVVDAIFDRDYALVQGAILVIALIYVLVNLLVDMLYAVVDPRIRVT